MNRRKQQPGDREMIRPLWRDFSCVAGKPVVLLHIDLHKESNSNQAIHNARKDLHSGNSRE
jgi:hypothetical protein